MQLRSGMLHFVDWWIHFSFLILSLCRCGGACALSIRQRHDVRDTSDRRLEDRNPSIVMVKQSKLKDFLDNMVVTMTALRAFGTLATLYQSTQCNIPEEVNLWTDCVPSNDSPLKWGDLRRKPQTLHYLSWRNKRTLPVSDRSYSLDWNIRYKAGGGQPNASYSSKTPSNVMKWPCYHFRHNLFPQH